MRFLFSNYGNIAIPQIRTSVGLTESNPPNEVSDYFDQLGIKNSSDQKLLWRFIFQTSQGNPGAQQRLETFANRFSQEQQDVIKTLTVKSFTQTAVPPPRLHRSWQ